MNFRDRDPNKLIPQLIVILASLLIVLAGFAILYVVFGILGRFYQTILLFVLGAILAYLLVPLVMAAQRIVQKKWAAILSVYLAVIILALILGALLVSPIVNQSQSLAQNLQSPAKNSLTVARKVRDQATQLNNLLAEQKSLVATGSSVGSLEGQTLNKIRTLKGAIADLKNSTEKAPPSTSGNSGTTKAIAQTKIPPSLVNPLLKGVDHLSTDYDAARKQFGNPHSALLNQVVADGTKLRDAARNTYNIVSTTPVVLLSLQTWLDDHGFNVNVHDRFGSLSAQFNNKLASLLGNAVNILLLSGTLLVNFILVLIISIYFVSDGARLIRKGTEALPSGYRDECHFFVTSLDRVMGAYIRGQIILALLAGTLGAIGAFVLGVPYAVLIGVSTTALSLIPVIGAVILVVPPFLIALLFTTPLKAVIFLVYFVVFMQVVTNIIGPRVIGRSVGIHPLEAMAAALVGYPLAGFLGSFFAVPVVGFIHVIVAEAHRHFVAREHPGDMMTNAQPAVAKTGTSATTEPEGSSPLT